MKPRASRTTEPAQKRRKVNIACESCRGKKARCDGAKPVCGGCSSRSLHCIYKVSTTDAAHTNEYVDALLGRVAQLERDLHHAQGLTANATTLGSATPTAADPGRAQEDLQIQAQSFLPSAASPVDAMGGNAGPENSPSISDKFYGNSSALSFTRQVYNDILRTESAPTSSLAATSSIPRFSQESVPTALPLEPEDLTLLPRHLADHLMSLYWSRVHVLYPFVHKASFKEAYEDLWKPSVSCSTQNKPGLGLGAGSDSGPSSIVFHCAFNAALALGMQFSTQLRQQEKERLSFICMEKSKKLLHLDLFDDGSMSLVQTLLLLTQYFQSTTSPSKCWTSIGVACRLAQGLGLHVESTDGQLETSEREMRKRVWHGCVTMDIVVSMALGRPAMLSGYFQRSLPEPVDEYDWIDVSGTDTRKESTIAFFAESVKLCRILESILVKVYNLNEHQKNNGDVLNGGLCFDVLIDIDQRLSQFARCLPRTLSMADLSSRVELDPSSTFLRQSNVLHVRFLHARIQLYRPVFFQYCRRHSKAVQVQPPNPDDPSPVAESFTFHSALVCVRTAIDLISAIKQYSGTEATGAWWYNVFYTRTAAMIVLLAAVCPPLYDAIGVDTWNTTWIDCQIILTQILPQSVTVRACSKTLEVLHNHVTRHQSQSGSEALGAYSFHFIDAMRTDLNVPLRNSAHDDIGSDYLELIGDPFQMDAAYGPINSFDVGVYSGVPLDPLDLP